MTSDSPHSAPGAAEGTPSPELCASVRRWLRAYASGDKETVNIKKMGVELTAHDALVDAQCDGFPLDQSEGIDTMSVFRSARSRSIPAIARHGIYAGRWLRSNNETTKNHKRSVIT